MTIDASAIVISGFSILAGVVIFFLKEMHQEVKQNSTSLNKLLTSHGIQEEKVNTLQLRVDKLEDFRLNPTKPVAT